MSGREFSVLGVAVLASVLIMGWIVWSERPVQTPAAIGDVKSAGEQTSAQPDVADIDEAYAANSAEGTIVVINGHRKGNFGPENNVIIIFTEKDGFNVDNFTPGIQEQYGYCGAITIE